MAKEHHDCCATVQVYEGIGYSSTKGCDRRGVIEHEGRWYCKQHDPAVKAAKEAARQAEEQRKLAHWSALREAAQLTGTLVSEAASGTVSVDRLQELALGVQAAQAKAAELSKPPAKVG